MSFIRSGWGRIASTGNEAANIWYTYKQTADTLATIKASAYFNDLVLDLTNGLGEISVGDVIHCQGSDTFGLVRVSAVTTNVTVEDYSIAEVVSGTIVNSDINASAAIEYSKMATMTGDVTTAANVSTIGAGVIDQAMIDPGSLNGTVVNTVGNVNVIGGIPVLFRILTVAGGTASIDVTVTNKIRVIDVWAVAKGLGTAGDTIQILNTASAITGAMDGNIADTLIVRALLIDDANQEIAASGTLRVTVTDGGGADVPAYEVYVSAIRVA